MRGDKMRFLRTLNVTPSMAGGEWGPSLPSVASLPARSIRWEMKGDEEIAKLIGDLIIIDYWLTLDSILSHFRSLPLPKLGLNNSCWNAGKETFFFIWLPVSACRSLPFLQSFPLKNPSKNSYRVCLFNSCVEVNHYISLLWLHCKWWLGWKPLCLPLT